MTNLCPFSLLHCSLSQLNKLNKNIVSPLFKASCLLPFTFLLKTGACDLQFKPMQFSFFIFFCVESKLWTLFAAPLSHCAERLFITV